MDVSLTPASHIVLFNLFNCIDVIVDLNMVPFICIIICLCNFHCISGFFSLALSLVHSSDVTKEEDMCSLVQNMFAKRIF